LTFHEEYSAARIRTEMTGTTERFEDRGREAAEPFVFTQFASQTTLDDF
jgi:hypothetical protein